MANIKKILGTFIVITFLLGAGSIYANVNAGNTLSNWYNHSFQKEDNKISTIVESGISVISNQVQASLEEMKENSTSAINKTRVEHISKAKLGY